MACINLKSYLDLRNSESQSRTISESSQIMVHVLKNHIDPSLVFIVIYNSSKKVKTEITTNCG